MLTISLLTTLRLYCIYSIAMPAIVLVLAVQNSGTPVYSVFVNKVVVDFLTYPSQNGFIIMVWQQNCRCAANSAGSINVVLIN